MQTLVQEMRELAQAPVLSSTAMNLLEVAAFLDCDVNITEAGLFDGMNNVLKKLGLHMGKREGLMQIAYKSGKNVAKLLWYALRAATTKDKEKREEIKGKLKEVANTKVTKEQFLNFLLMLDQATLHLITGPIHFIEAVTGWHLWANIKNKIAETAEIVKKAIEELEEAALRLAGGIKDKFMEYVRSLKQLAMDAIIPRQKKKIKKTKAPA